MAAWLPVLKASLPYVSQIVTAALPAFTSKPPGARTEDVVPRQIAELQEAVTENAGRVKELATQLKEVLESMDSGAAALQDELAKLRRLTYVLGAVAAIALIVAAWALLSRT